MHLIKGTKISFDIHLTMSSSFLICNVSGFQ